MFYIKNAKSDRYTGEQYYGVVDTDDWVLEYHSEKTLLRLSEKVKINGISEGRFEYYDILPFVEKELAKLRLLGRVPAGLHLSRTSDWSIELNSDSDKENNIGSILQIPAGVEIVSMLGVKNNSVLKKIIFPNSVRYIEPSVFFDCRNLTEVKMSSNIEMILDSAFKTCRGLEGVDLGNCLKEIGAEAFKGCASLSYIKLPESLNKIGSRAFKNCNSLKELDLPSNLGYVGNYAFFHCTSLKRAAVGGTVRFGEGIFADCENLKSVDFSFWHGVTITSRMFKNCLSLKTVQVPNSVQEIGSRAFESCLKLETMSLPSSVCKIGISAFESCVAMTSLEFEDRLTRLRIEEDCFRYCRSLVSVKLPKHTDLGIDAFYGCEALEEVIIEADDSYVNFLAFKDCTSLRRIEIRGTSVRGILSQMSAIKTLVGLKEVVVSANNNWIESYKSLFGDKLKIVQE